MERMGYYIPVNIELPGKDDHKRAQRDRLFLQRK
jgi:hypothetical protein